MGEQDVIRLVERATESLRSETRSGFDRIDARLHKHGGLIVDSGDLMTAFLDWSEKMDHLLTERDRTIEELKRRVARLEAGDRGKA